MSSTPTATLSGDSVGWHDAECGCYTADLPLWRELAGACDGTVCDLGCGTGRVSADLAARGHRVLAVDRDPELLAALQARTAGLQVQALLGDVRDLELQKGITLALAPMQLAQLLDGPSDRGRLLSRLRSGLEPGGRAALAIVEPFDAQLADPGPGPQPVEPDVAEDAGRRYESVPVRVSTKRGGLAVERRRRRLAPGEPPREERATVRLRALDAATLEGEGRAAGLKPAGRRRVPATPSHVGSTVVVLEAPVP